LEEWSLEIVIRHDQFVGPSSDPDPGDAFLVEATGIAPQ
jgi:hypothetical protein